MYSTDVSILIQVIINKRLISEKWTVNGLDYANYKSDKDFTYIYKKS